MNTAYNIFISKNYIYKVWIFNGKIWRIVIKIMSSEDCECYYASYQKWCEYTWIWKLKSDIQIGFKGILLSFYLVYLGISHLILLFHPKIGITYPSTNY